MFWKDVVKSGGLAVLVSLAIKMLLTAHPSQLDVTTVLLAFAFAWIVTSLPFLGFIFFIILAVYGLGRGRLGLAAGPAIVMSFLASFDVATGLDEAPRYDALARIDRRPTLKHDTVIFENVDNMNSPQCLKYLRQSSDNRIVWHLAPAASQSVRNVWYVMRAASDRGCAGIEYKYTLHSWDNRDKIEVCKSRNEKFESENAIILRDAHYDMTHMAPYSFNGWEETLSEKVGPSETLLRVQLGGTTGSRFINLLNIIPMSIGTRRIDVNDTGEIYSRACDVAAGP